MNGFYDVSIRSLANSIQRYRRFEEEHTSICPITKIETSKDVAEDAFAVLVGLDMETGLVIFEAGV